MDNELLDGFYLESTLVEPLKGAVSNARGSTHLPSKSIEVLLLLAKQPRRLVTREQIITAVWGDGQGSPAALNHAIGDIRQALDDHADAPSFIQTVPTRGYRLLVEPVSVHDVTKDVNETVGKPEPARSPVWDTLLRHGVLQASAAYLVAGWALIQVADASFDTIGLPPWSEQFVTFVVIGGLPVVIILAWFLEFAEGRMTRDRGKQSVGLFQGLERNYLAIVAAYGMSAIGASIYHAVVGFEVTQTTSVTVTPAAATEPELLPVLNNSLAVLRFLNIDGDPDTQIFSDGLSEDILDGFARLPGILVSSRSDAWSLPANPTSENVRRRLRVAYFIEGSVRFVGDRLRVVVQFIDSENGFHIFSRAFDQEIKDVGQMQKEVTSLVMANMKLAIGDNASQEEIIYSDPSNADAYVMFLRGREALHRPGTRENILEAIGFFDEAETIDSDYPAAHAGRCNAYVSLYELESDSENIELAESACARALEVAPRLPLIIDSVARLYRRTGRYEDAETMYQTALQVNDRDVTAIQGLALIRRQELRFDDAEELMRKSIELQPGNWNAINTLGNMYFRMGRFVDAIAEYRKVVYLDPANNITLGNLGSANMMTGNFAAAAEAIQRALEISDNATFYSNLGIIHYYLGEHEQAIAMHRKAIELAPNSSGGWISLGDALHQAGQETEATVVYNEAARLALEQLAVNPEVAESLSYLAWSRAMTNSLDEAKQHTDRAVAIDPADPYSHYYDALVKDRLGDTAAALDSIELALENGYPAAMLAAEPILKELHENSRFADLLETNGITGESQ